MECVFIGSLSTKSIAHSYSTKEVESKDKQIWVLNCGEHNECWRRLIVEGIKNVEVYQEALIQQENPSMHKAKTIERLC